jgi:non-canonical (house-cleaning) NTP pyrophosphatase
MLRRVVTLKLTDVSQGRTASKIIAQMLEAVGTSEKSGLINVITQRHIPEDSKLHTRRRENLKSHKY